MNTQEVANRLVELCRTGQNLQAIEELYSAGIVSREPEGSPAPLSEGIDAVKAKSAQWYSSLVEMHSAEITEPIIAGNHFSVVMKNDGTFQEIGRVQMEEVCIYEVKDGKVVAEQFFYDMAPQG